MQKQNFAIIAITLLIIVAALIGALALMPHQQSAEQTVPAQSVQHQPFTLAGNLHSNDTLFAFGDGNDHHILLELASAPSVDYTLHPAPARNIQNAAEVALCTHTGAPVVAAPPTNQNRILQTEPLPPTFWKRVSAWLTSNVSDTYIIALWSSTAHTDKYVLVSGDGPGAPIVCPNLLDEDV